MYDVLEAIALFMGAAPPALLGLVYLALVVIPIVLLHELGHAIVALRRRDVPVEVSVLNVGRIVQLQLGRIRVTINALPHPNREDGRALFDDEHARAYDIVLITLAGPAASLLGLVFTAAVTSALPSDGLPHDVFWAATLAGAFGVLNAVPLELEGRRGGPAVRTDGRVALDALRHAWRSGP